MKWQPIETAPKDGRYILVSVFNRCRVVWWNDSNGWTFAESGKCTHSIEHPTHWMPLPEPPIAEQEGK